jgi:glycosyltransferase involved in cell wall biosynthesis
VSINLLAPLNSLGYGVVGLNTALALERAGAEPAVWPIGPVEAPPETHDDLRRMIGRQASYDVKAPSLRLYHQFDLAQHVGKGPHCGMPIFELNRFKPNELHHLKSQDIVFANSHWAGEVLRDNGVPEGNIFFAPLGVDTSVFRPNPYMMPRDRAGEPTVFLNIGKWEVRKGHDVIAEAFCKAFEPKDNVRLVMHCHNPCLPGKQGEEYNRQWERLYETCRLADKVVVSKERFPSQHHVARLMEDADCGVFPSRAEGWGLESAEMLAMGKHVIITNYSAHTEYADETNAHLIQIDKLEDAHDGVWFRADSPDWDQWAIDHYGCYRKPGQWAELGEAQIEQLVEHMRRIHRLKCDGKLGPNTAGIQSMNRFTWDNTASEILGVLGR